MNKDADKARADRLAQALRENLKRRKAQARADAQETVSDREVEPGAPPQPRS